MTLLTHPMPLKGGRFTLDPRLDRVMQVDLGTLNYPVSEILPPAAQTPRSYTWDIDYTLDQANEGRCVEFGICAELLARPVLVPYADVVDILANRKIYWQAQREDEWEGGSYPGAAPVYEGTSVNAGMKVAKDLGFYSEYRWAFTLQDFVAAVGYHGPGVIGVDFYNDMFTPDADGFMHVSGSVVGGHCMLVRAVHVVKLDRHYAVTWKNVDLAKSYVLIHNSWGLTWGDAGDAKIALVDLMKLWPGGEFCIPVRRNK